MPGGSENAKSKLASDNLYGDERIVITPHDVYTGDGLFDLTEALEHGVRPRLHYAQVLLGFAVVSALLSDLGMRWLMLLATGLGAASLVALAISLTLPRVVYLRLPKREVAIYRTRSSARLKAVLDALNRAPTARRAEEHARHKVERDAENAAREAARIEDERLYEALVHRAASSEPMPFHVWATSQSEGHLLTSTAEYLAVQLDEAYGGPAIVDRFFERGLNHIVLDDMRAANIRQRLKVEEIVERRSDARRQIAEKRGEIEALENKAKWKPEHKALAQSIANRRESIQKFRGEAIAQLDRQYFLALELRLLRLARQYEEMMWGFPRQ